MTKDKLLLAALALLAVTLLAYGNTLGHPFHFDTEIYLVHDDALRPDRFSVPEILERSFSGRAPGRPLTNLTLILNRLAGGDDPFGYHLANLFLHAACAFILFLVLIEAGRLAGLSRAEGPALAGALLWVANPLQTQAVTYVVQRAVLLSAFFTLLTLLLFLKARRSEAPRRRFFLFGGSLFCLLLAIGGKEVGFLTPFLVLLADRLLPPPRAGKGAAYHLLALSLAALAAGLYLCDLQERSLLARTQGIGLLDGRTFTGLERVLTQGRVLYLYLSLVLLPFPSRLGLEHAMAPSTGLFSPLSTPAAWLLSVLFIAYALRMRRKRPFVSLALLWFYLAQSLEASFLNLELVFEHRCYLPSAGLLSLLGGWGWLAVGKKLGRRKTAAILSLLVVLLALGAALRNRVWADPESLWRDAVSKAPGIARPLGNLSLELEKKGRYAEAAEAMEKSLRAGPGNRGRAGALAVLYLKLGRPREAAALLSPLLAPQPPGRPPLTQKVLLQARCNLAGAYIALSKPRAALAVLDEAGGGGGKLCPSTLAAALLGAGRAREAEALYRRVLSDKPGDAGVLRDLAVSLMMQKRHEEALGYLGKVLRFEPDNGPALLNAAWALYHLGRPEESRRALGKAEAGGLRDPALKSLLKSHQGFGRK